MVIQIPAVFWSHLFWLYLLFIELFIQTWPGHGHRTFLKLKIGFQRDFIYNHY